jgi:hypothetical protein
MSGHLLVKSGHLWMKIGKFLDTAKGVTLSSLNFMFACVRLDGYWDLRNGELSCQRQHRLTFDRNKSFRKRFTDISS